MARLAPQMRTGLVPALRQISGFQGFYAFASQDGHIVLVCIVEGTAEATLVEDAIRGWGASNLGECSPRSPEVTTGKVVVHEAAQARPPKPDSEMFVVVRHYDGLMGSPSGAERWI